MTLPSSGAPYSGVPTTGGLSPTTREPLNTIGVTPGATVEVLLLVGLELPGDEHAPRIILNTATPTAMCRNALPWLQTFFFTDNLQQRSIKEIKDAIDKKFKTSEQSLYKCHQ